MVTMQIGAESRQMSPVNDFVFGDIRAKSAADQRRQKFWGEPVTWTLDV